MMRRLSLLLCASLFLLLFVEAPLAAQGQGVIEGQVMNGTAGAPLGSLAGLEVDLYEVAQGTPSLVGTTTTDWQGRFSFEGIATSSDRTYRFQLEYQGILYGAEAAFPSDDTVLRVVATIYETTTSDSGIVVDQQHVIVDFATGALVIRELYVFNNSSDTIYVGDEGTTLRFSLPAGARDLTFRDPELAPHLVETEEGFAYVRPVMPGQREVLYSYGLPYDGRQLVLSRRTVYPAGGVDVMIANVGVQVQSSQLQYQGLTGGGETAYLHFSGHNLPAGSEIELSFSGPPQPAAGSGQSAPRLSLPLQRYAPGVALLMVILGACIPFAYLRLAQSGRSSPEGDALVVKTSPVQGFPGQAQRDELLHLIADLDDAYAEGLVNEQAYGQLRDKMKKRLRDVWQE